MDKPLFDDRMAAGHSIADQLLAYRDTGTLIVGIPRGGVVVAAAIAARLHAHLDVIVARKIGAPGYAELAIGAVTASGYRYLNDEVVSSLHVSAEYVQEATARTRAEASSREQVLRGPHPAALMRGRTVIVVDDGLATGATMLVALRMAQQQQPSRLLAAVPVGSKDACAAVRTLVDALVCIAEPRWFQAVGSYFRHFEQVDDDEVFRLLTNNRRQQAGYSGST